MVGDHDPHFEQLLHHIKAQRGFDFTGYKRPSLMRRVQRRLDVVGIATFEDYLDYLEVHPHEFGALFDTVLINVTGFFRDPDAWTYLRQTVVPAVLERNRGPVRVWSAGCASGEEAFSVAMTFADVMGMADFRERVKIYATDVDDDALAKARMATYDERQVDGVPPDLLERYFVRTPSGNALSKDLRRPVIFGRNDLVQDAPISRVDLVLCRNTLMYFNAETQGRMIRRLHFALVPDGFLFLGKAEMLLSHTELFQPVELKRRFFRRVGPPNGRAGALILPRQAGNGHGGPFEQLKEEALLAGAAAQVVVASSGELVTCNRRAELLFGLGVRDVGRPFSDLEMSYRPVELRSAIDQAVAERQAVWVRDVEWRRPGTEAMWLDIQVVPLFGPTAQSLGVSVICYDVTRNRAMQLELEETNRRLELAYEELQSANEELETTNEELQIRTLEVSRLNEFTETVLAGLRAGVAVVDPTLRVLAWNAEAVDLWGVREDEALGSSLEDLDIGLPLEPLRPLVLAQLAGTGTGPEGHARLAAVNRRGRPVEVDVTVSPLSRDGQGATGAIVVMNVVGS